MISGPRFGVPLLVVASSWNSDVAATQQTRRAGQSDQR
jgi:hypothetical protein